MLKKLTTRSTTLTEHELYKLNHKPVDFPTSAVEWKLCKGKSTRGKAPTLSFDAIKKHQIDGLLQVSQSRKDIRVPDSHMMGRIASQSPFDEIHLNKVHAFVAVVFLNPSKPKLKQTVYYIMIQDFLRMKEDATKKSFTEKDASNYALYTAELNGKTL